MPLKYLFSSYGTIFLMENPATLPARRQRSGDWDIW
jgi:hypothetical protein